MNGSGLPALRPQPRPGPKRGERLLSGGGGWAGQPGRFLNCKLRKSVNVEFFMSASITEREQSQIFPSLTFLLVENDVARQLCASKDRIPSRKKKS